MYPLYPFLLSMAFPDGSKRDPSKSKLLHEILLNIPDNSPTELGIDKTKCAYVINYFQKDMRGMTIIADTYQESSIKPTEKRKSGNSTKVLICSIKSRLPSDMNKFMLNNDNETPLIKLPFKFIIDEKQRSSCTLDTEKIILSVDEECITVTYNSTEKNVDLKSNQEETDTKVILHAMNVIRSSGDIVIRSPSGDTEIVVLALASIDEVS